jgi:hypothetical protein
VTYYQQRAELKTVNKGSFEAMRYQIASGSGQAQVIALDIQSTVDKWNVIKAIRKGWGDNTKKILLNYNGQWYDINKNKVFGKKKQYKNWLEKNL